MNLKDIKEIINLMNENDLAEIEVEREGLKLKVKKAYPEVGVPVMRPPLEYRLETPPSATAAPVASSPGEILAKNQKDIVSPMVGTFYRSPSPESPPFVEIGQVVEMGQVVCIVEAMKLMNEIKSEVRGKVVQVLVENAQPVEFGQPLFLVEPV